MKSYVFSKNINKSHPFRVKASNSFIGASTHSWWGRESIKGPNHAMAMFLFNRIFINL